MPALTDFSTLFASLSFALSDHSGVRQFPTGLRHLHYSTCLYYSSYYCTIIELSNTKKNIDWNHKTANRATTHGDLPLPSMEWARDVVAGG
jgi:hypothetical protein